MSELESLFEAIRENCNPQTWSKGVEIARRQGVRCDQKDESEIICQVADLTQAVSYKTTVFPEDEDWHCSCPSTQDPCHHVAATIIAFRRAEEKGESIPQGHKTNSRLIYRFQNNDGELFFDRVLENPDGTTTPIHALQASSQFAPSSEDYEIESILGGERRGFLRPTILAKVLARLTQLDNRVILNNTPIQTGKESVGITIHIRDEGPGVHVQARKDQGITETFKNGAALFEGRLHPLQALNLDHEQLSWLQAGRVFGPMEMSQLVSHWLPAIENKYTLVNTSHNLPRTVHAAPQLSLELNDVGGQLRVSSKIVYGNPPIAVVEDGGLRPLAKQIPARDFNRERQLRDSFYRQAGFELGETRSFHISAGIEFVNKMKDQWSGARQGNGWQRFKVHGQLEPSLEWNEADFSVSFHLPGQQRDDEKTSPAATVLSHWQQGESLVPLMGGGFAHLPKKWLSSYGATISRLITAKQETGEIPPASLPTLTKLMVDLNQPVPDRLKSSQLFLEAVATPPESGLPDPFHATPRDYQMVGINWLNWLKKHRVGAILADDMGLGKTLQTLAVLESPTLVVAPTSVIFNWRNEINRFRPDLAVNVYHGPSRKLIDADITLTSYALARLDLDKLAQRQWQVVVLDEAQNIKNPESQAAQACFQLPRHFAIALSGTPIENRLEDLWSLFRFTNPGHLGGIDEFKKNWVKPINSGNEPLLADLRAQIGPYILRRLKRDVAPELPKRTEAILYAQLSDEERQVYDGIAAATTREVVKKLREGGTVFEALEALLRLRQACCHLQLLPGHEAEASSKTTLLVNKLSELQSLGHKSLVFSQWTGFLDLIEAEMKSSNISSIRLDGSTRDRGAVIAEFQKEDGPATLIMSLKAGGVGLNLSNADHVFIMDPWWNPFAEDQAADRAHRIGQTNPVMIHPIIAVDTVEMRILELQAAKRQLAEAALSQDAVSLPAPSLSRDDLVNLLDDL